MRFAGLPHYIKDWKHGFFFLSSTMPWPCLVEWAKPSKLSFKARRVCAEPSSLAMYWM
jgi:hypothetical protein